MKQFKVTCLVEKPGNNSAENYTLFIKANDATEAERSAKHYCINNGWGVAQIKASEHL